MIMNVLTLMPACLEVVSMPVILKTVEVMPNVQLQIIRLNAFAHMA